MTNEEITLLEKIGKSEPLVKKLLDEYLSFQEDPSKILYLQATEITKVLAEDLGKIAKGDIGHSEGEEFVSSLKLIGSDASDKTYDRVMKVLLDLETIFKGLRLAKQEIMPDLKKQIEEEENKSSMSAIDRRATKNKTQ